MAHQKSAATRKARLAFTLVEMLVVVLVILIVSAAVIPQVLPMLSSREVSEAARILQAGLTGARDAAIRANQPCGIRLLPDVTLTDPPLGTLGAGTNVLAYSRWQAIELAADYNSGRVNIGPMVTPGALGSMNGTWPPLYPSLNGGVYPYPDANTLTQQCLMVEESPFAGGFVVGAAPLANEPTSWFWNIRIGDKIRLSDTGSYYTVIGPCTVNPIASGGQNPELFVNAGAPGTISPLLRTYYTDATSGAIAIQASPEFLFLVNGIDDSPPGTAGSGYVDEGFDGFDNNYNGAVDEVQTPAPIVSEWEQEKWLGSAAIVTMVDAPATPSTTSPSAVWVKGTASFSAIRDKPYTILRQPVPTEGARETSLPSGVVIDATTWNMPGIGLQERSRLPVNPYSLACDVLVTQTGQLVPNTLYSTPTSATFNRNFLHFWISKRTDVVAPVAIAAGKYQLPMPKGTASYPDAADKNPRFLDGPNMLVTLYPRSGMIASNTVDQAAEIDVKNAIFTSGFLGINLNQPFFDAQQGFNAAKP